MEEVKEVVLLWLGHSGKKRIAAQLGLDVKSVRRYVRAAYKVGLRVGVDTAPLSDAVIAAILKEIRPAVIRERGAAWARCEQQRAQLVKWLKASQGIGVASGLWTFISGRALSGRRYQVSHEIPPTGAQSEERQNEQVEADRRIAGLHYALAGKTISRHSPGRASSTAAIT